MIPTAQRALVRIETLILINRDRMTEDGSIPILIDHTLRAQIQAALEELAKRPRS